MIIILSICAGGDATVQTCIYIMKMTFSLTCFSIMKNSLILWKRCISASSKRFICWILLLNLLLSKAVYFVHFSLLHSSTARSSFNQNLSGHALIRHALQNPFLWTLCQNWPNLPTLPTRTQWILQADHPPEVHIILDPQIFHGIDIDEYKLAPLFF